MSNKTIANWKASLFAQLKAESSGPEMLGQGRNAESLFLNNTKLPLTWWLYVLSVSSKAYLRFLLRKPNSRRFSKRQMEGHNRELHSV